MMQRTRSLAGLVLALGASCQAIGEDPSPVTPQRPTFSQNTRTTAEGTVEIEAGLSIDPDDELDLPTVLKYGFTGDTELFLGFSPYKDVDQNGADDEGFGDLLLGVRHRFYENAEDDTSAALRLATKLPTADEERGLGSGEIDFFAAGSFTKELETIVVTGYYQLGVLGDPSTNGDVDLRHDVSGVAWLELTKEFQTFVELTGIYDTERADQIFTTLGGTYALADSLVFDAALVLGINSDAPDLQLRFGLTTNLGPVL